MHNESSPPPLLRQNACCAIRSHLCSFMIIITRAYALKARIGLGFTIRGRAFSQRSISSDSAPDGGNEQRSS